MEVCNPHQPRNMPVARKPSSKGSFSERLSGLNRSFTAKGATFGSLLGAWQKRDNNNTPEGSGKESRDGSQRSQYRRPDKGSVHKNAASVRSSIASLNSSVAKSDMMSTMKSFSRTVCSVLSEEDVPSGSGTSFSLSTEEFEESYEMGEEVRSSSFCCLHEGLF